MVQSCRSRWKQPFDNCERQLTIDHHTQTMDYDCISELAQGCISELAQGCISELAQGCISELAQGCISELAQGCISELAQGCISELAQKLHQWASSGLHQWASSRLHQWASPGLDQWASSGFIGEHLFAIRKWDCSLWDVSICFRYRIKLETSDWHQPAISFSILCRAIASQTSQNLSSNALRPVQVYTMNQLFINPVNSVYS